MNRPARVQCSKADLEERASEKHLEQQHSLGGGAVFNLWHRKWAGGDKTNKHFRSSFRCSIERDSGYTKSNGPFFCVWFARGCCYKGRDCAYLHRLPEETDVVRIGNANTTDCFGRTKFAQVRDDMGGIGSFMNPSRTLCVGSFRGGSNSSLAAKIRQQFQEWGDIENILMAKRGSIAYVKYKCQLSAEFAKESMSAQTITGHETLTIKWSQPSDDHPDSVPEYKVREIVRSVLAKKRGREHVPEKTSDQKHGVSAHEDSAASSGSPPPKRRQVSSQ